MRIPRFLLAAAVGALAVPALADPPATTTLQSVAGTQPLDSTTQQIDLKTRNDGFDRMTVPVRIGGAGPFRFLIDTGADRTAISRELAGALRLPPGHSARLHSVTGQTSVDTVMIGRLDIAQRSFGSIEAPLLASANLGADGLLGVDSLRSQNIRFDFKANTMSITPSAQREERDEPGTIVVRARQRNGRLILTEADADGVPVTLIIDTGSQVTIGNAALRRRLLSPRQIAENGKIELQSVTGAMLPGDYTFLKKLELGGVTIANLGIAFADAHTFAQLGLDRRPALLLGMNAMRAFEKVSIDFAQRKLRVLVPKGSSLDGPELAALGALPCANHLRCRKP